MADLISVRDGASNHVPNLERKILSLEEEVKVLRMELEAMAWAVTMKEAERSAMEAEVSQARQMASEIDEYKRGMVSEMEELKRKLEVSMDAEERMAREITFLESEALHDAMDSRSLIESLRTDIRYKEICLAAAAAAALDQLQVLAPSPYNQASDYTMNMLPRSSSLVPWQADMKSSQIEEATMSQGTDLAMALPGADLAMAPQGPDLAMAPPSIQDQQSSINRNATNTSAASLLKSSENIPVLAPAHEAKEISSVLPSGSDSSSSSKQHGSAPILTSISNSRMGTPLYNNNKSIGSGLGSSSRRDQSYDHHRRSQLLEQASKTLNDRQAGANNVAKSPSINSLLRKFSSSSSSSSSSSKKPATNWWAWSRGSPSNSSPTMSSAQDISSPLIYTHA